MEVPENMEEKCRLCDEVGEKMFSIFDKNEEGHQFLHLIKECLPIIIYRTDPLSKQICERCCFQLESVAKFKKISQDTAERHKEKLKTNSGQENTDIRLFLGCDYDLMEGSELKDASTSTEDLTIHCNNCKQSIVDPSAVNGELELCTDLHKAIAESMRKNKVTTESVSEKLLRRRKVVPFYHELDDSICSSLTEFTQNTEGSQCFEMPSDEEEEESVDSDETQRPSKRRRIFEDEIEGKEGGGLLMIRKPAEINGEPDLGDLFGREEEYRYQPLSLLQLTLNVINTEIVPDYEPYDFIREVVYPKCNYCQKTFQNLKILALHETGHMDVEMGEKIDNPVPWHHSRENADIRNKWLNYFDENGYEDEDIIIDEVVGNDLLIPMELKEEKADTTATGSEEQIVLVGTQPMVNNIYLGDYTKEERKSFYQSMRIQGVNKKFCHLCRYCFKDNWAIESHYFSSACYYTCRYCGMRFNKQRHRFNEHVEEHKSQNHDVSDKIFAASKLSNVVPKVINPQKVRKVVVTEHDPPQPVHILPNTQQPSPPTPQNSMQPIRVRNLMERRTLQPNLQIKEEPQEPKDIITSQSKTGNQAYFCRKCYKVFFKLDEFNIHSKNCDYNQFPQIRNMAKAVFHSKNGEVPVPVSVPTSPAGRPIRNCAKEIGPYKDEAFLPDSVLKDPKPSTPQSFVCFICNTPFPTIYSRNSHMRIHKGETQPAPSTSQKARLQVQNSYQNYRTMQQSHQVLLAEGLIKQEPMDMPPMEPMVEIHEPDQNFSGSIGDGAVSITPISKNPRQKATINPNIMRIVQNNPQLSIKKSPEKYPVPSSSNNHMHMAIAPPDLDKSYKCSSCWEAFANKSHLYFHKKNQCEGSRFPCPFCKKRFGTEAAYSSHIFYSHPE